jgi:spore germination protein GerM
MIGPVFLSILYFMLKNFYILPQIFFLIKKINYINYIKNNVMIKYY